MVNAASDQNISGAPFVHRDNDTTRFLIRDITANIPAGQGIKAGSIIAIKAGKNRFPFSRN